MPREVTREQFIQITGMTPEEFERKHADRVSPLQQPQPKTEAASARAPKLPEASSPKDEPYRSDYRRTIEESGQKLTPLQEVVDFVRAPTERLQKNVIAGVLSMPSSVAGAVDLVRKGVPAVGRAVMSDSDDSFLDRVGDEFMQSILPPEGLKALEEVQLRALGKYKLKNPNATEQDVENFLKKYAESDEFYNETLKQLPAGLRISQEGQNWANKTVGLDKRADKMTAGDEAMQIFGSSLVGLPAGTVAKLTKPVVKAIGTRVADNIATKVAARAIEALTPMTLPLTPGNVALNTAVGIGVNEALRGLQGEQTLIDYQNLYNPEKLPPPDTLAAATGLSAAALFGLPAISRIARREAEEATSAAVRNIGQSAGPTLEEQSGRLQPQLSPVTGLIDQNAPVKKAANLFKSPDDTETVPLLDAAMSSASVVNRVEYENNALNYGILEGLDKPTVPFTVIQAQFDRLDPATKDLLDKYVYAVQRKQDATIYEQSLIKQVQQAQTDLATARMTGHRGRIQEAEKKLVEVQQKYTAFQNDDPSTRSSMVNWSRADVDDFIRAGEQNPAVKQIADAMRRISNDLVDFMHKNGVISSEEAARRLRTRDLYVPLQERAHPKATGLRRRALLFKDRVAGALKSSDPDQGFFISTTPRDVSGSGAKVNNPKTAIIALQEGIMDAVRSVAANNTRRDVIDRLAALPGARGTLLRPYEFNLGNGRTTTSISPEQYAVIYPRGVKNEDDYVKIFRNGKIELWEFSDKSITQSLKFAPISTVPIFNATRKFWQQMTTGLGAPWFTVRAFLWDVPLAQTTKNAGRSLGLMDTLARRLAEGTSLQGPVNTVFDYGIPGLNILDAGAATFAAIPYQLGLRAARAVGDKIATDLATNSGLFSAIAQSGPRGAEFVRGVGTFMATAFDQSALGVMSRNMSTSLSHLNDVSRIRDDYAQAATKYTGPLKTLFEMYKAMAESIHMSTRTAFFASNYGRLKAKYGDDIPASEIKKLVQETRNLTGDMSRQSNSPFIQKLTSVIPYSNATIQGTRHILSAALPEIAARGINAAGGNVLSDRNTRFWSQFTGGVLLPVLGSAAVLSNWEGAEDYWYNLTPKWKQMTFIPVPNVEALEYLYQNGQLPKFDPKYLNEIPLSPEFALVLEPVKAALRAMGLYGGAPTRVPQQFSQQVKDVLDQITDFSTPPILSAFFAMNGKRLDLHGMLTGNGIQDVRNIPTGGANADMMTTNSDISQTVYNTIGALAGTAVQLVMQSWNVFDISKKESDNFWKAASDALDTASFEVKRRFPQIDVPGLFKARQRYYQSTPEAEYVYRVEEALEPVIGSGRQVSVERDSSGRAKRQAELGLIPAQKLQDQNLRSIATVIYNNLSRKGPYKEAKEAASELRADMAALEAARYKVKDDVYNARRNDMIAQIQQHTRVQSQVLQKLERQLQQAIGRRFLQQYGKPFSFETFAELVRRDVAQ